MCDSPELLAALATLTRAVEKQTLKRGFIDQTYEVSDTQGFILDYKGYRYLFVYAGTSLTFLIGSSSYSIAANTWTPLQFKEGYKIFTSGTANPTGIRVRATDDLFAIIASATVSIAANASVNVNEVAGTATSVNNGTTDAGTQRVTLSSNSTGQVTANAGTNLNTSLLALETGGNLASIKTDTDLIVPGVQGWIAATGTGTATTDDSITFTQQVRIVALYNASPNPVPLEFDQTAAASLWGLL